jgi:DNA polymerase I
MEVTKSNHDEILSSLDTIAAIDTETTGLRAFDNDELFSIIISTKDGDFYFNYKDYDGITPLNRPESVEKLKVALSDPNRTWFMQNAKFDLRMLAREGLSVQGTIHDLMVLDRLLYNQNFGFSLSAISKRHGGEEKSDAVSDYIDEHGLKETIIHEHLGKEEQLKFFDRVPYDIIRPYGEQDGRATLTHGLTILKKIDDTDLAHPNFPKQMAVVENESRLVHTLFRMESRGVLVNDDYCHEALKSYKQTMSEVSKEFKERTGLDFVKGTTVFEQAFASEKDRWDRTEKGNWKWDADTLRGFENPAAKLAIAYSEAKKQSEYFANFLFYKDKHGVLHPDFQQSGTVTGRLSCRDPNLQNLTNPDRYDGEADASMYPVRRALIPRPGFFFASLDYSQVEFRILLEYAKAMPLIREVLAGHDVHTATGNLAKISRKEAKTCNFLTVYGGGVVKLANGLYETTGSRDQLGYIYKDMFKWRLSDGEARAKSTVTSAMREHNEPLIRKAYDIQQSIFRAAPEIKDFLKQVQRTAENRKFVFNYLGRRYQFPDPKFAYKAPNHVIQGGAADIIKVAMNRVDEYLKDFESKLILSIHDELIIEVKFGEEFVIDRVKEIMESSFKSKHLPLLVEVEYSNENLADKVPWPLQSS